MYHRVNKFQDALKCFSKVLVNIKNDKTVYIARGIVYADMGNHQLAINDFNDAISHDKELAEGYYRAGMSKYSLKRFKEAIEDFKTANNKEDAQIDDDNTMTRNPGIECGLAQCYHSLREYEKAMDYYMNALEMDPKNTNFLMSRAQCYYDQK